MVLLTHPTRKSFVSWELTAGGLSAIFRIVCFISCHVAVVAAQQTCDRSLWFGWAVAQLFLQLGQFLQQHSVRLLRELFSAVLSADVRVVWCTLVVILAWWDFPHLHIKAYMWALEML